MHSQKSMDLFFSGFCVHSASESQKSCVEDLASYLPKFGQLLNRTSSKEFWNFRRQIFIFPNLATVQWTSNTIASSDRGEDRHIPEIPCHKDRSKSIPRKQKSSVTRLQILPNGDLVSENTFVFENVWNIRPNKTVEMPCFRVLWIFARKGGGQSPARKWPWLISLQTCQISNLYNFLGKALGRFANALQCQRSQQLSANSLGLWKTISKDSIQNSWVSEKNNYRSAGDTCWRQDSACARSRSSHGSRVPLRTHHLVKVANVTILSATVQQCSTCKHLTFVDWYLWQTTMDTRKQLWNR